MDGQLGLQPLLEGADGLVLQVVVRGDASVRQRLDGASVLRREHNNNNHRPIKEPLSSLSVSDLYQRKVEENPNTCAP